MALTLAALARSVGGECVVQRIPSHAPIDEVVALETFGVVGNAEYVTLVTGTVGMLLSKLREVAIVPRVSQGTGDSSADTIASPLSNAVYVGAADSERLRATLVRHGMTAILGAQLTGIALHAQLSALIAANRAAEDRLVTNGMNVLTQVAKRGGIAAVVAELAHRVDGWIVLLDAHGNLVSSAGAGRLHVADARAVALGSPVRVRSESLQLYQVGADHERAGYLVIAARTPRKSYVRDLATLAAALLDLLFRSHDPSQTEQLGREALLRMLLAGGAEAGELLRRWGVYETHLTGFVLGTKTRTIELERLFAQWCTEHGAEQIFVAEHGRVHGFLRDNHVADLAAYANRFTSLAGHRVYLGIGTSAVVERLQHSAVQAKQAFDSALHDEQAVQLYDQLPTVRLLLSELNEVSTMRFEALLQPLCSSSTTRATLIATLRVFLTEHGAYRATARQLGIHRQTVVARIARIEALTGLSLDRADDRAAAWLGLRVLDR